MKACSTCGEVKPLDDYPPDKRRKDGKGSQCRPCRREVSRRFRERHPGYDQAYYERTRERHLARQKAWREANPELARQKATENSRKNRKNWTEYLREYRVRNQEKLSEYNREWRKANPERCRELSRKSELIRRARKRQLPYEDVIPAVVFERDAGVCGICGQEVSKDAWHVDHIIPLAAGGSHTYENVQVAHPECNLRKGARVT